MSILERRGSRPRHPNTPRCVSSRRQWEIGRRIEVVPIELDSAYTGSVLSGNGYPFEFDDGN
jgi:hypothetical protein